MRITRIEIGLLRVPLKAPFRTALRTVKRVEDVVVFVHGEDGFCGYGEAPPTAVITGDTHGSIIAAIGHHLAPALLGEDVADLARLAQRIQAAVPGNPSAKAAMDIAVHDLWAQSLGAPLYRLLGGEDPVIHTDITISVGDVDAMVAASLDAVAAGFRALKIKLGKDSRLDVDRVLAIRAAVGSDIALRLDANQAWTVTQTVQVLRTLEDAGVCPECVEQPVPAHDIDGLCEVTASIDTPVIADEAVFGPEQALEIIWRRAADIINIKLMKAGGVSQALRIADIAAEHGVECMVGCMLESSISVAAAAHVVAARRQTVTRVDLDGPALCRYNPVDGGAMFAGPVITLADAPGLGIRHVRGVERLEQ